MAKGPKPLPLEARFWRSIVRDGVTDCWLWSKGTTIFGYGQFGAGSLGIDRRKLLAHRFSFEIHHGPIPHGLCVLHRCDVPACVNPAHLFVGTKKDNALDRTAKGRSINGNTRRTHCLKGHPFDRRLPNGERRCSICMRVSALAYYYRKKANEVRT